MDKEEFDEIFEYDKKIIPKKFKSKCKKYKINYYKKLISIMKEEKPLNIILYNARIHTSKIVEEACEILSVNLVFLPSYGPFLSPIEDV